MSATHDQDPALEQVMEESLTEAVVRANGEVQKHVSRFGADIPSDLIQLLSELDGYVSELAVSDTAPNAAATG